MATADEFIDAAQTLADSTHPGVGHFRRAISTAYYAAFHCVVEAGVAILFTPQFARDESRRWFEHGRVADVAKALAEAPSDPAKLAAWLAKDAAGLGLTAPPEPALREFGQDMRSLYEKRQMADYFGAPALQLGKGDALLAIGSARAVCRKVDTWTTRSDASFERVVFAMLSRSIGAKKR